MLIRIVLAVIGVLALLQTGFEVMALRLLLPTATESSDLVVLSMIEGIVLGVILFVLCIVGSNALADLKAIRQALERGPIS